MGSKEVELTRAHDVDEARGDGHLVDSVFDPALRDRNRDSKTGRDQGGGVLCGEPEVVTLPRPPGLVLVVADFVVGGEVGDGVGLDAAGNVHDPLRILDHGEEGVGVHRTSRVGPGLRGRGDGAVEVCYRCLHRTQVHAFILVEQASQIKLP